MAKYLISTTTKCKVGFNTRELSKYELNAFATKYRDNVFVDFTLPYITYKHRDRKVAEDVIEGMKMVARWAMKLKHAPTTFFANVQKPVLNDGQIIVPVFPSFPHPLVRASKEANGYWRWDFEGHAFNDDLPSIVRYLCCIQKLLEYMGTLK